MLNTSSFCIFLHEIDPCLSTKFEKYITVQVRDGKKILILKMGLAPEIDIDELISLKSIWEDFGLIDPDVASDPFLITGTVKYLYN
jgi:hypothetical protein